MDEVKAMTRAGETVGKTVGTGLQTAREGVVWAGHRGAEVSGRAVRKADQSLADRGLDRQHLQEAVTDSAGQVKETLTKKGAELRTKGRRARKELAKAAKQNRKHSRKQLARSRQQLAKATKESRRQLAKSTKESRKQLAKNVKEAGEHLAASIDASQHRGRRKWPWVLIALMAATAAGVAAYLLSRRPEETFSSDEDYGAEPLTATDVVDAGNGRHSG